MTETGRAASHEAFNIGLDEISLMGIFTECLHYLQVAATQAEANKQISNALSLSIIRLRLSRMVEAGNISLEETPGTSNREAQDTNDAKAALAKMLALLDVKNVVQHKQENSTHMEPEGPRPEETALLRTIDTIVKRRLPNLTQTHGPRLAQHQSQIVWSEVLQKEAAVLMNQLEEEILGTEGLRELTSDERRRFLDNADESMALGLEIATAGLDPWTALWAANPKAAISMAPIKFRIIGDFSSGGSAASFFKPTNTVKRGSAAGWGLD